MYFTSVSNTIKYVTEFLQYVRHRKQVYILHLLTGMAEGLRAYHTLYKGSEFCRNLVKPQTGGNDPVKSAWVCEVQPRINPRVLYMRESTIKARAYKLIRTVVI